MATIQQYRHGDVSKLISSSSDKTVSKKRKTDEKLETLFGGNTRNLHLTILPVESSNEPVESSNEKIKSNDTGLNSISEHEYLESKGSTTIKVNRKHKINDEELRKKFRNLEGKKEDVKPRKETSYPPGYCPPLGIVHEAILKQRKTLKRKNDIDSGDDEDDHQKDREQQRMKRKWKLKRIKDTDPCKNEKKRKNDIDSGDDEDDHQKDREQQRMKRKWKLKRIKDTDPRTIFIGNLSLSVTKKKLLKLFKKYGEIETIRYRCLPPADPKIPKKVVAIKKDFHSQRHNCVAYILFTTKESAEKALESNGMQVEDLHIHVDLASQSTEKDKNRSIFVGNVPFDIEDEAIRNHFQECGTIENVRVIRDKKTGLGKGFCYVLFQSKDSVSLALKLNNSELRKRQLRVMRCTNNFSKSRKDVKKINSVKYSGKSTRIGKQERNQEKTKRGNWQKAKAFTPSNMKRSPFQEVKAKSSKFKKRNKEKKKRQKKINKFP